MSKSGLKIRSAISLLCMSLCFFGSVAQTDEEQTELRLNPEIELDVPFSVDVSKYPFLRLEKNRIEMNGADWTRLRDIFAGATTGDSLFSVVYLGDSHIQADFGGDVLRERLMAQSRPAGRGITIPFRLASTNQPNDYTIRTESPLKTAKLLRQPWVVELPFTGVGVQPTSGNHTFNLTCKRLFSRVNIYYKGCRPEVKAVKEGRIELPYDSFADGEGKLSVQLDRSVDALGITLHSDARTTYAGFELLSDTVGTVVHSIGNNGATYGSYTQIDGMGEGIARLHPDLVIIALGTNEAFGRVSPEDIRSNIDALVSDIKKSNPCAQLLLVGPAECYRKTYRWVRRKGRRRRVSSTVVNTRIKTVRDVIRKYAAAEGIPYYDHYDVAGGDGAAARMKAGGILGKDGIHYSATGYKLWGSLLADAILVNLVR